MRDDGRIKIKKSYIRLLLLELCSLQLIAAKNDLIIDRIVRLMASLAPEPTKYKNGCKREPSTVEVDTPTRPWLGKYDLLRKADEAVLRAECDALLAKFDPEDLA